MLNVSYGQEQAYIFKDSVAAGSWLTFSGFNYYTSNRFNNDYLDKWLFGGEITQEIKDKPLGKIDNINSIGGEFENGLTHYSAEIHPFKLENWGLMLGFSDNHYFSANIPADLYRVAMYGNSNYMGDTMDFNFAHFQYQHFQKISIGMFDKRNMSSLSLSYVAGSKGVNARLGNSWMYNDVDTIQLAAQGNAFRTDRFAPYWAFQGSGFAFDLDYNFMFENKKGARQIVNFKIKNLGVIFWNKSSYHYSIDSVTTYDGFDIQEFLMQNEDTSSLSDFNILDTLGLVESQGSRTDFLAPELVVQKLGDQASLNKVQLIFGFKAILSTDYFPYFYAGGYVKPTENFSFSSRVSYGGFGGFKWGLHVNYWIKDKVYLGLGTFDMIGNISKKFGYGRGMNLTASFKF
ncbi:hypothetical protein JYT21_00110 [bacterium AH-315-B15]|nr:hypothetical protein [bacterium AH-315-B15]MBN4082084.1 hypothetical protein [bacterium AH-315-B15]